LFAVIREKRSLIFYCEMILEWGREEYTVYCTRSQRSGLAWFKTGIWKLRGVRKGCYPLCREEDGVIHILLKCSETRKWREQFLNNKWLNINEDVAYKIIINCTNAVELINKGNACIKLYVTGRIKLIIYNCKW
jgi:hypothetical protein